MKWRIGRFGREEDIPVYDASAGDAVAILVLDPAGIEFLCERLPQDDSFTDGVKRLRKTAEQVWWNRAAL